MSFRIFSSPIRVANAYITVARFAVHACSLSWIIIVFLRAFNGDLPGDPVQYLTDFTGIATLNLLFLSLSVSPIAEKFKFGQIIILRKTLGVYAAFYGLSHLVVFVAFELQFEWGLIANEIIDRPYITVGFTALIILTALLATSFQSIKRKMGSKWQKLHRWVYLALILGIIHFLWSIKAEELQAYVYAGVGVFLLLLRKRKIKKFFK